MKKKKKTTSSNQYRKRRSQARKTRQVNQGEPSDQLSISQSPNKQVKKQKVNRHLVHEVDKQKISSELEEKNKFHQKITDKQEKRRKKNKFSQFLKVCLWLILLIIIGLGVFYSFIFDLTTVETKEMGHTLQVGEKVLYHQKDMNRFSVVKVNDEGKSYWSRIIGIPGDTLEMENDTLYINGLEYEESYLKSNYLDFKLDKKNMSKNYTKSFNMTDFSNDGEIIEVIPEGYYLVLSDDRENDVDSRFSGLVKAKDIEGVATLIIWPPSRVGALK